MSVHRRSLRSFLAARAIFGISCASRERVSHRGISEHARRRRRRGIRATRWHASRSKYQRRASANIISLARRWASSWRRARGMGMGARRSSGLVRRQYL